MEYADNSDVGRAYTKWEDFRDDPAVSAFDKGVAELQFRRYHTVVCNGDLYALHEDGVNINGKAVCCGKCANQIDKCILKMNRIQEAAKCKLFFKFDPSIQATEIVQDNNVVRLCPLKDTWIEWDYGKPVSHYIDRDGTRVEFQDQNGKSITWKDLSDGEIQVLTPVIFEIFP